MKRPRPIFPDPVKRLDSRVLDEPEPTDPRDRVLWQFRRLRFLEWCLHCGTTNPEYARMRDRLRNEIAAENLGLVKGIYARNRRWFCSDGGDELISAGNLALMRAIDRFDPWRGFTFSTFAWWAIVREMARASHRESRIRSTEPCLYDPNKVKPRREILQARRAAMLASVSEAIQDPLTGLTCRERSVILARSSGYTLDEIGNRMKLTKERVRQIWEKGIRKIRMTLGVYA